MRRAVRHPSTLFGALALGFALALTMVPAARAAAPTSAIDQRFDESFDDPALAERYERLTRELRCLQCQNQTIADSHAPLATDLRHQVHRMLLAGSSDEEIVRFMTTRYGDYVLFKPPFNPLTALLWAGPFLLLGTALALWWRSVRRRAQAGVDDEAAR